MSDLIDNYVELHWVGTKTQLKELCSKGFIHELDLIAGTRGAEAVVQWLVEKWTHTPMLVKGYVLLTKTPFYWLEEHQWQDMANYGWAIQPKPNEWRTTNQTRLLFEIIQEPKENN